MSAITVRIKMKEGCHDLEPKKAHHDDAAFDLRSSADVELPHGETILVPTGLHIELPEGYEAQVRPRSGMSLKHSLLIVNSPGTVDAGYRGEVGVIMHNLKKESFHIKRGDRIAQMVINKLPQVHFEFAEELTETKRGEGGFGSTGHK